MTKLAKLEDRYFRWEWINNGEPAAVLTNFYNDNYHVYDADSCGSRTSYWVVGNDGRFNFFVVRHSWAWENYGEENSNLVNEIEIKEITEADARKTVNKWPVV